MGITRRFAGGSGAAAADVSSQKYQQMALALAQKELEIRKLTEEKSEYKRKYEDLYSSVLKALADGVGRGAPPPAAAAASGARAQDNKDKKDGLQDKNFPLKVHRRLSKPVVADSSGKIHEKVEDPSDRKNRLKREAYHRNKRIRAELMEKAGVAVAASGARRTDDKRDDRRDDEDKDDDDDDIGSGQSSSASGAAALEAEVAALEAEAAAAEAEAEAAEAEAAAAEADSFRAESEDTAPEEPPSKKSKKTFIREE